MTDAVESFQGMNESDNRVEFLELLARHLMKYHRLKSMEASQVFGSANLMDARLITLSVEGQDFALKNGASQEIQTPLKNIGQSQEEKAKDPSLILFTNFILPSYMNQMARMTTVLSPLINPEQMESHREFENQSELSMTNRDLGMITQGR